MACGVEVNNNILSDLKSEKYATVVFNATEQLLISTLYRKSEIFKVEIGTFHMKL